MEHEWGRNVFEFGLGDIGATLASRVHGGTFNNRIITNGFSGGFPLVVRLPSDMSLPYSFGQMQIFIPGWHFPYHLTVDPDAPV